MLFMRLNKFIIFFQKMLSLFQFVFLFQTNCHCFLVTYVWLAFFQASNIKRKLLFDWRRVKLCAHHTTLACDFLTKWCSAEALCNYYLKYLNEKSLRIVNSCLRMYVILPCAGISIRNRSF